jgi:O-antigen/teichoic acid export membrane protein
MSVERKAISALKWATAAKLIVQLASWAGTLLVVRLLSPDDYGLMAKVGVVSAIAGSVAELGLEAALIRAADLQPVHIRRIYGVSLALGAIATGTVMALAPLLSRVFQDSRLVGPISVASLQIILGAAAIVPSGMAARSLSFRLLSTIEILGGATSIAVTVLFALLGAGVWALVLGNLSTAAARCAAFLSLGERVRPDFSLRGIGEHLKFGLTVAGNRLSYFIVVQSDVLVGMRFLSTVELGRYAVALQLATLPMAKVMGIVNQIALPTVAQQQHDLPRLRQSLLKALGLMSLASFPALWGIAAVAPELVGVLFGGQWREAVPALQILPLIVPLRMACSLIFTASLALGNRQLDLRNTVANFVLLPTGFYIGAHWGLVGLCSAWLVAVPLAYSFSLPRVLRAIGVRPLEILAECGAPAAAAGVMVAAVSALRLGLPGQSPTFALISLSLAGAMVYFATVALISPRHVATARRFMGSALETGAKQTSQPT